MLKKVLILGAYGIFGKRITQSLAKANIPIIMAGRDNNKITELTNEAKRIPNTASVETAVFDINKDIHKQLALLKPYLVINTCGPFQIANYNIAEACIEHAIHYVDLADGRDFVNGIHVLDQKAKAKNIYVISGASTLPTLSAAVVDHLRKNFSTLDSLKYGISPGIKTARGLATVKAILSYLGKPLKTYPGAEKSMYGWQDIYRQDYPGLGKRWMCTCDIPDLDLFPAYYGLKSIQFSAGMESSLLHFSMWTLSWLVRLGLPLNLSRYAKQLLHMSHWFDWLGTQDGGMHMILSGTDLHHKPLTMTWFLIARNGDGPYVPTIPAIVLAKKFINGEMAGTGAIACMGLITLDEYLAELKMYQVETFTTP